MTTRAETARTKSITLDLPNWIGHRAGQHVDVRLTAEDGYRAERSYSIASPPEEAPRVTLTVERIDDGEVSPYLTEELCVGDKLEQRGPNLVPVLEERDLDALELEGGSCSLSTNTATNDAYVEHVLLHQLPLACLAHCCLQCLQMDQSRNYPPLIRGEKGPFFHCKKPVDSSPRCSRSG